MLWLLKGLMLLMGASPKKCKFLWGIIRSFFGEGLVASKQTGFGFGLGEKEGEGEKEKEKLKQVGEIHRGRVLTRRAPLLVILLPRSWQQKEGKEAERVPVEVTVRVQLHLLGAGGAAWGEAETQVVAHL